MSRRARRALAAVLGALVLGSPTAAGAQAELPLDVQQVDQARHPHVSILLAAPRGLVGRDLVADDFVVTEKGEPRSLRVERLPNEGLEVVLVIDTSGSMQGDAIAAARRAANDFVATMPAAARIAVVGFGDEPTVASDFTTDHAAVVGAVDGLEARGETALYDALARGAEMLGAGTDSTSRRFIVLLSDGGDTASTRTLDDAVASMAAVQPGFFAVALATSESDLGALGQVAQATGGKVAAASSPAEIAGVYESIASVLVNQYRVTYRSESEGPTAVAVRLQADGVTAGWAETLDLPPLPAVAAPPEPVEAAPFTAPAAGPLASEWTLLAGAIPFALALAIAAWMFVTSRRRRIRRPSFDVGQAAHSAAGAMNDMAQRATAFAERMLDRNDRSSRLNSALERAGLSMRPAEFVVLAATAAVGGATFVLLLAGPAAALVTAGALAVGSWSVLGALQKRRQAALADQLGDTLQLLAGSLRSGHGLVQALDMVTREAESPTAEEFHRVLVEARLGRDLSDALDALAKRAASEDLEWVVQAIRIHREVGGDLAEILDRVGETIRDRNRVRGQVRSLTAEGRLSAIVLMALPFLVGMWMWFTNRPYVSELFTRPQGRAILGVGAVLMAVGGAVLKRLVRPEF